ncbi:MAG: hypothetical protein LBS25_04515 [Candidatus Symbiothrix sp.]|jgi:hypothetical protein|nr:hypothetical protein [Candidatus Symbiothrix sp.]
MKVKTIYGRLRIKPAMTIVALWIASAVSAQTAVIQASLDSMQILIGEQVHLHLKIAADQGAQLQLPYFPEKLIDGVEVLEISQPDTTDIGNNRMQIRYDYLITSFDSALYLLPPFPLIVGTDTCYSNELALKVSSVSVDTESGQFFDIKDILVPELVWQDYIIWLVLFIALRILTALITVLLIEWKKKNRTIRLPFRKETKPDLPPHIRALQALDAIKSEKLWQRGKEKEYYSQITDVVRTYIDERFQIAAMEMTTGEILLRIRSVSAADFVFDHLKRLLFQADLVKFAKYRPLPEENEMSIGNAYFFVDQTIPVPKPEEGEKQEESPENETK